ncbi:hypothetical protein [Mesorhizobium sp.]|uniref:hypothetical protein n=1 Tax=Mesorhizobium sp. TaxID=1871066 RepID=UPI000FE5E358|nr:hypothetical protein [Mesorhizobium sp.]RWB31645.1 MAG: hypothetical protein EOQ43_10780 [Mesorhizobium sp.]
MRKGGIGDLAPLPLLEQLPGLEALFRSFPVVSETERMVAARRLEDWNPLGQRLLLPDATPAPASEFEAEFSLLVMAAQSLVEWSHEAIHMLAVEPWCVGRLDLSSKERLSEWYLAAEGLAFWYADIVVTRAIRRSTPETELIYCRSSVSNAGFHPEEAFRRVGLSAADELLEGYLAAFLGRDSALVGSGDPLASTYYERLKGFYRDSRVTLGSLSGVLTQFGATGDYWRRFCRIDGLPALTDADLPDEPAAAMRMIGMSALPGLRNANQALLESVRIRRMAQIRAWHGWMLREAARQGWIATALPLDEPAFMDAIEAYLDDMERALVMLGAGSDSMAVARIEAADRDYERLVRAPLQIAQAVTRYRYWIFPYFEPTGGLVGLWDARTDYSHEEAEAVLRFVSERCDWDRDRISLLAEAFAALQTTDRWSARAAFNRVMLHPMMRSGWSIDLGVLSPGAGNFRELLFEFH